MIHLWPDEVTRNLRNLCNKKKRDVIQIARQPEKNTVRYELVTQISLSTAMLVRKTLIRSTIRSTICFIFGVPLFIAQNWLTAEISFDLQLMSCFGFSEQNWKDWHTKRERKRKKKWRSFFFSLTPKKIYKLTRVESLSHANETRSLLSLFSISSPLPTPTTVSRWTALFFATRQKWNEKRKQKTDQKFICRLQEDPPTGVSGAPTDNNIMIWNAVIFGPHDTPFEDGTFKLTIEFTEEYPNKPPTVRFVSKMFHPNVYVSCYQISL